MSIDIVRAGLCQIVVCADKGTSDEAMEAAANEKLPTGIASQWSIRRHIAPVYCECQQDPTKYHVIMEC